MAKVLKERARAPLLDSAHVVGGLTGSGYSIDVYPPHGSGLHSYQVILSRSEMLDLVQSWLSSEARRVKDAERAAS